MTKFKKGKDTFFWLSSRIACICAYYFYIIFTLSGKYHNLIFSYKFRRTLQHCFIREDTRDTRKYPAKTSS